MKNRANWILIPAVAIGLAACDQKKPETPAPDAAVPPVTESVSPGEVPVPPSETPAPAAAAPAEMTAEARAARLGFARYLPQDTEGLVAFYDGSKTADRMKNSKLWKMIQRESGMGAFDAEEFEAPPPADPEMDDEDMDIPETEQEATPAGEGVDLAPAGEPIGDESGKALEGAAIGAAAGGIADAPDADAGDLPPLPDGDDMDDQGPAALFGKEVTIAMGKDTGAQIGNLLTVNRRVSYFQMRHLAKSFAASVKAGDVSSLGDSFSDAYGVEMWQDLIKDPESGVTLLERAKMPPLYIAFRVAEENKASAAMQMASMIENINMMGEGMVEPVKIEAGGVTFEGAKVLGAKISASMAENRESMEEEIGAEPTDRLIAAVAKKDIVVVSGTIGDYVLLFIGGAEGDLKLAADAGSSLAGSDALKFTDGYASKDLAAVVYSQKESTQTMMKEAGGISDMTDGIRDGLAGAEGLGDTRDLDALFKIVAERGEALQKMATFGSSGMIAFFEDGLKVEGYSGSDAGMIDWKAPNKLAHLGEAPDVLLFADLTGDAEYDKKATDYLEAIAQTAYAMTMKVANTVPAEGDMAQFKEMAATFDTKFRPDAVVLWDAFEHEFHEGLGKESAVVVDLKGGAPAIPGVPQAVVDEAKVPRISYIAPVVDRAKLSGAWTKMDASLKSMLGNISEMTGQDIPMQKPLSSEKDDKITWFFPMPFLTDDFIPSVTLTDKWFVASTSRNQAIDLINQAAAGGETRDGFYMKVDFKNLQKYAETTLDLVSKNAPDIMGGPLPAEQERLAKEGIAVLDDIDSFTMHSRKESGVVRTSLHFKTR